MRTEPAQKRAVAFVDGQNLFHAVRESFGYPYPNYDVKFLCRTVCESKRWALTQTRFYTGIPDPQDDSFWHHFWSAKLSVMGRQGIHLFSRSLRYRNKVVKLPDGTEHTFLAGEERGVDIRIALDIIRLAHRKEYDVALIFSQDQDLSEVAEEIRLIAREQGGGSRSPAPFPSAPPHGTAKGLRKPIGFELTGQPTIGVWISGITDRRPRDRPVCRAFATEGVLSRSLLTGLQLGN